MTESQSREVVPILEMIGTTKHFGEVRANDGISFDLRRGEIHALVGENGAGKTTLMKILYGMLTPDSGVIKVDGQPVHFTSPADAIDAGIGMVHQHFMLVPSFSIVENVMLGSEPKKFGLFDLQTAQTLIKEPMTRLGLKMDPMTIVGTLNVASQQKIEIVKVLYRGASIIIFDEPTAVLTPQETDELFILLRKLANDGCSIIFISHKLQEVFAIAERITVLRNGKTVTTVTASQSTAQEIVTAMTGKSNVNLGRVSRTLNLGEVALTVENIHTVKPTHDAALEGVNFSVRSGEILGIAGVEGNGQSVLAEALIGIQPLTSGVIRVGDHDVSQLNVSKRREFGVAFVSEDRQAEGLPIGSPLVEGLAADKIRSVKGISSFGKSITKPIRDWARKVIVRYDIKTSSEDTGLRQLSGGNQQKVVVARELESLPLVLILAQPTRGVDLGAIALIYAEIVQATERGCAVVLISADLDEIMRLSDRVVVMYEGNSVSNQDISQVDRESLGLLMTGMKLEGSKS